MLKLEAMKDETKPHIDPSLPPAEATPHVETTAASKKMKAPRMFERISAVKKHIIETRRKVALEEIRSKLHRNNHEKTPHSPVIRNEPHPTPQEHPQHGVPEVPNSTTETPAAPVETKPVEEVRIPDIGTFLNPKAYKEYRGLVRDAALDKYHDDLSVYNKRIERFFSKREHFKSPEAFKNIRPYIDSFKKTIFPEDVPEAEGPMLIEVLEAAEFVHMRDKSLKRLRDQLAQTGVGNTWVRKYFVDLTLKTMDFVRKVDLKALPQSYKNVYTAWAERAHGGVEYHPMHTRSAAEDEKQRVETEDRRMMTESGAFSQRWRIDDEQYRNPETGERLHPDFANLAALIHTAAMEREASLDHAGAHIPQADKVLRMKIMLDGQKETAITIDLPTIEDSWRIRLHEVLNEHLNVPEEMEKHYREAIHKNILEAFTSWKPIDLSISERALLRQQAYSDTREDPAFKEENALYRRFFGLDDAEGRHTNDHYDSIIDYHTADSPFKDMWQNPASLFIADGASAAYHMNGETGAITMKTPHFEYDGKWAFISNMRVARDTGYAAPGYQALFEGMLSPEETAQLLPVDPELQEVLAEEVEATPFLPQDIIVEGEYTGVVPKIKMASVNGDMDFSPNQTFAYAVGLKVPFFHTLQDAKEIRIERDTRRSNLQPVKMITAFAHPKITAAKQEEVFRHTFNENDDATWGESDGWVLRAPVGKANVPMEGLLKKLDKAAPILWGELGLVSNNPITYKNFFPPAVPEMFSSVRSANYCRPVDLNSPLSKAGVDGIGSIGDHWNPDIKKHLVTGRFEYGDFQGMWRKMAESFASPSVLVDPRHKNIDAMNDVIKELAEFSRGNTPHEKVLHIAERAFKRMKFDKDYIPHNPKILARREEERLARQAAQKTGASISTEAILTRINEKLGIEPASAVDQETSAPEVAEDNTITPVEPSLSSSEPAAENPEVDIPPLADENELLEEIVYRMEERGREIISEATLKENFAAMKRAFQQHDPKFQEIPDTSGNHNDVWQVHYNNQPRQSLLGKVRNMFAR